MGHEEKPPSPGRTSAAGSVSGPWLGGAAITQMRLSRPAACTDAGKRHISTRRRSAADCSACRVCDMRFAVAQIAQDKQPSCRHRRHPVRRIRPCRGRSDSMEIGIYHEFSVLPGRSQAECFAAGFDIVDASEEYGLSLRGDGREWRLGSMTRRPRQKKNVRLACEDRSFGAMRTDGEVAPKAVIGQTSLARKF
jgi:hypothetical protein